MKKKAGCFALMMSMIMVICLLGACGSTSSPATTTGETTTETVEEETLTGTPDAAGYVVKDLGDAVCMHTALQKEALDAGYENILDYCDGTEELSVPEGAVLKWTYEGTAPSSFIVSVGTSEDMADARTYTAEAEADANGIYQYALLNLYLGKTYYYTISDGSATSDVYHFTTETTGPRNLYVEGVTNVRDLGGYSTSDGGQVKQGMIYRCAELNYAGETTPCITENGVQTMLNEMGVRTEIDFRKLEDNEQGGITESPLGSSVAYYSLPIVAITDISPEVDSVKKAFELMADANNYPMIYHCKIGTDRTGLISYLLLNLLGVSKDDVYTDYTFSNFANIEGHRNATRLDKMISDNFSDVLGSTDQETAVNYLLSIGVTQEELDSIVSILVEK